MIEYKTIKLPRRIKKIDEMLAAYAYDRWRVVCAVGKKGRIIILKRKLKREDYEND